MPLSIGFSNDTDGAEMPPMMAVIVVIWYDHSDYVCKAYISLKSKARRNTCSGLMGMVKRWTLGPTNHRLSFSRLRAEISFG